MENPVTMSGGDFAEWAEQKYGVDFNDVRAWDMLKTLDSSKRMPEGFELGDGKIPTQLYSILMERKAARLPSTQATFDPTPDRWDFDGE